jgi:hypothetical protein
MRVRKNPALGNKGLIQGWPTLRPCVFAVVMLFDSLPRLIRSATQLRESPDKRDFSNGFRLGRTLITHDPLDSIFRWRWHWAW